ncbi:MAG TPA: response regulator, partial [Epsilonproteobacteria bacterium]|nr:response regulator [Campylobacterota bacterium]
AHVLIVDDNMINQKIIVHMLSKSNIKVSLADNGKEALDVLHEHGSDIDIILMDINMPVMDGYQATKKLRTNHRYDSLPVVIVSTLGFRNEIDEMYLAGANAHLRKPFKAGELYGALFMFLIESNPDKSNKVSAATYQENSGILDIQQGLASTKNIFAYYDLLREDLLSLSDSDHKIKKYIIQKDFLTLKAYCRQLLEESRSIGAISLEEVLSEMYILLTKNEEQYLPKYIKLYHDEWLRTKRHIELYLKSVNMF